ncbi:MAG: response regulator [Elusimicrobia bacterium]|nr:response regulator [Elusimicrobiota bacterium]
MAKILIVDDEPAVVLLMTFILEKVGHTITKAYNGQEALKALGVNPPDPSAELPELILLDVMMPIVDGYTVAITLRNDPRAAVVPILVITAKTDMRQMFNALPNVKAFFNKPFDPQALRDTVAKILKGGV